MDLLNGLAAIATCLSFGIALWRSRAAARRVKAEQALVASLEERIRLARAGTRLATELADNLVQRLKGTVRTTEALGAARSIRAALRTVDGQLDGAADPLAHVPPGALVQSLPARQRPARRS